MAGDEPTRLVDFDLRPPPAPPLPPVERGWVLYGICMFVIGTAFGVVLAFAIMLGTSSDVVY